MSTTHFTYPEGGLIDAVLQTMLASGTKFKDMPDALKVLGKQFPHIDVTATKLRKHWKSINKDYSDFCHRAQPGKGPKAAAVKAAVKAAAGVATDRLERLEEAYIALEAKHEVLAEEHRKLSDKHEACMVRFAQTENPRLGAGLLKKDDVFTEPETSAS